MLQRCIDFATPAQKTALVDEIARNALSLAQDAFGNYVAQYVLELGHEEARQLVMTQLTGAPRLLLLITQLTVQARIAAYYTTDDLTCIYRWS